MKVDISKTNLLEKDIEDWLFKNPDTLESFLGGNPITHWLGRQYQLPSGIADLIGVREDKMLVVVEVKNVPISKAAVLQVCRYTDDLKHIVSGRMDYPHLSNGGGPIIEMILVGPAIDDQTFTEALAVGVRVLCFTAELNVTLAPLRWTREHRDRVEQQHEEIANRSEWAIYGPTIKDDLAEFLRNRNSTLDTDESSEIVLYSSTDDEEDLF